MSNLKLLNINIGLLGHVDSGKTSLAKCLSQVSSTACFDKHPQSKERGITIDLGFSSFTSEPSDKVRNLGYEKVQYTLVDCPGHASLIRTIIGGIQIIDHVILVIDITKGIQTQTAECLVITEITKKPLIVVLNKTDLIESSKRSEVIQKVSKKIDLTFSQTVFHDVQIVPVICKEEYHGERGIDNLIKILIEAISIPKRFPESPLILAIDHCFTIKGKGTIITGTVLQGTIKKNNEIELPSLQEIRKVKTIQMFKQEVNEALQGDRIGISVPHLNHKLLERGMACKPGYLKLLHGVVINFNKVKYFKTNIKSNTKFHISIGYETLIGRLLLFGSKDNRSFNLEDEYFFIDHFDEEATFKTYALIQFEKSIYISPENIIIGSKLDTNVHSNTCRISFFGSVVYEISDKNYLTTFLPQLKIYKLKTKTGYVKKVMNEYEIICHKMFQKTTSAQKFLNMKVILSTGDIGHIDSTFGQKDKVRIRIPNGLKASTFNHLAHLIPQKSKEKNVNKNELHPTGDNQEKKDTVLISLQFKKYLFDKDKAVTQNKL